MNDFYKRKRIAGSTKDGISNNNSEQTPIFQPIKNIGDEGGQFIFVKKK